MRRRTWIWAAIAILFAIPFDALDGRIARMTNTASEFGKELDSLSDAITFGIAPSLLAFVWGFHFLPDSLNPVMHLHLVQAGAFICFLFLLSGVSRLARFNISQDAQPHNPGRPGRKYFVGMPIPAAAGLLAATIHLCYGIPVETWWISVPWLVLVGLCGFLMISTWRFWSAKEINFSRSHPFQTLLLVAIVVYAAVRYSNVVLFAAALVYMFSGLWARAAYSWSRRRRRRPARLAAERDYCPATKTRRGGDGFTPATKTRREGPGICFRLPERFSRGTKSSARRKGCTCTGLPLREPRACWAGS